MSDMKFNTSTFVIDNDYIVKSHNDEAKKMFPDLCVGQPCYKAVRGYDKVCPDCPILTKNPTSEIIHKTKDNEKSLFATFSNITLENGDNGYIVNNYEVNLEKRLDNRQYSLMKHKMDVYRQANYNCAYLYFECNLSQNAIVTDIYEVIDYVETPLDMVSRGFLTKPIAFTDFTAWRLSRGILSNHEMYSMISDRFYLIEKYNEGEKSQSVIFKAKSTNGYLVWQQMAYYMYKTEYSEDVYALCVLSDISRKREIEQNTKRNEEIMRILASEYQSVLYFDLETKTVSICSLPRGIEKDMKYAAAHYQYKDLWKIYLDKRVQNSDKEKMERFSDIDYLLSLFNGKKSFTYIYRVGTEVDYLYHELKVVKVEGNEKALVIGIADKHDAIITQQDQQRQLEYALLLAQKDSLTGIRNRTAYDLAEKQIDKDVEDGKVKNYAILMCDVNNLKLSNDKYGHDKGNELLINSSKLICDIFKHSMVCRIGGDEFVIILKGVDYDNRYELLTKLRETVVENEQKKLPSYQIISIATGLADFDPKIDKKAEDVFHRADSLMYQNKAVLKKQFKRDK